MISARRTALTTIASLAVIGASAVPASAQYYASDRAAIAECERSDDDDQVIGAVVGGLLGGLVGDQIDSGVGTAVGAAGGAYAGAEIANKDCDERVYERRYEQSRYDTSDDYDRRFDRSYDDRNVIYGTRTEQRYGYDAYGRRVALPRR